MRYRYFIVDVFTERVFGGNQLAVLPDARGLDARQMQQIAREFNFSETTFVLPPDDPAHTRKVRIFTPGREVPFAGHPNVGTAFALAASEEVKIGGGTDTFYFEEQAGLVPVAVKMTAGKPVFTELTAPQAPQLGAVFDPLAPAAALGLNADDIISHNHPPRLASAGLPFMCIELRDLSALAKAKAVSGNAEELLSTSGANGFLLYSFNTEDETADIRARMYAPLHGVPEDPATGSAAAALAGLLALSSDQDNTTLRWSIAQGVEMGRPSRIQASAEKENGAVRAIRVGGCSVMVADGWIDVPGL